MERDFGFDTNPISIKERPINVYKPHMPGPGYYDVKDEVTKLSARKVNFTHAGSKSLPVLDNCHNLGPGTYSPEKKFGEDAGQMTIGVKREEKQKETIGPGTYEPNDE